MNFLDRLNTVFHHRKPDQIPFAPYSHHLPRGDFEREMRNRGVGLIVKCSTVSYKQPNVKIEREEQENLRIIVYHTPMGNISTSEAINLSRTLGSMGSWQKKWMIEDVDDYAPVIFMIEDSMFYPSNENYYGLVRDLGKDGIPYESSALIPPYDESVRFFGLMKWSYEQVDHHIQFANLLRALERRVERKLPLIINSPAKLINVGTVEGSYGLKEFEKYMLPFYKIYIPLLHEAGKICVLHAHNLNLKAFKDLISQTGVDVVEAFTPPPVGDLSIAEARTAWGPEIVILVNFPETVFYGGKEQIRQYILDLLRSDPTQESLVIGFTEMGASGIVDDESERIFKEGIRTIMDAIEEVAYNAR